MLVHVGRQRHVAPPEKAPTRTDCVRDEAIRTCGERVEFLRLHQREAVHAGTAVHYNGGATHTELTMSIARMLILLLLPVTAAAITPEEDEARIEALISAERDASRAPIAAASPASTPPTAATPAAPARTVPASPVAVPIATAPTQQKETTGSPVAAVQPVARGSGSPPADAGSLSFDDLKHHVGEALRFTMASGSQRYARVQSADSRQVIVLVRQPSGTATLTLQRSQITAVASP